MSTVTATALREALEAARPAHPSLGFPAALRERAGAWLRDRHAEGAQWTQLARELGISRSSATNWARRTTPRRPTEHRASSTFLPVCVTKPSVASTGPVLVTPRGYRVEELALDELAELLERLG